MSQGRIDKIREFYSKQEICPYIKWTKDEMKVQRAVCTKEGNSGGACKYNLCPKVNINK